jgi:hypothetical protein
MMLVCSIFVFGFVRGNKHTINRTRALSGVYPPVKYSSDENPMVRPLDDFISVVPAASCHHGNANNNINNIILIYTVKV